MLWWHSSHQLIPIWMTDCSYHLEHRMYGTKHFGAGYTERRFLPLHEETKLELDKTIKDMYRFYLCNLWRLLTHKCRRKTGDSTPTAFWDKTCPVCYCDYKDDSTVVNQHTSYLSIIIPCRHVLHTKCLDDWYDIKYPTSVNDADGCIIMECMICRNPFTRSSPIYIRFQPRHEQINTDTTSV